MTALPQNDPYDMLQVSPNAEIEVIEAAYKRLARKYHPDVNHSPETKERMQNLNWAYEILSDSDKRREYDNKRERGKQKQNYSTPIPQSKHSDQPSATIDDITQRGIQKHLGKIEQSNKVKKLKNRLDPIVRTVLQEVGNAQSRWLKKTRRTPDVDYKFSQTLPLILDLLFFFVDETLGKYSYHINGCFDFGPPYESYSWCLDWKRFLGIGYTVTLRVKSDGVVTLGMGAAYNLSRYTTPTPIYDLEQLSLPEIKKQLQAQAVLVYQEKIGV